MITVTRHVKGHEYRVSYLPGRLHRYQYQRCDSGNVYTVQRGTCTCPARKPCKHMADAEEIRYERVVKHLKALADRPPPERYPNWKENES